jgi:hypothetical protein
MLSKGSLGRPWEWFFTASRVNKGAEDLDLPTLLDRVEKRD